MTNGRPEVDLHPHLLANRCLANWLRVGRDGTITAFPGKVDLGQGISTALAQIVAEELDVPVRKVRIAPVDTDTSPDERWTTGSMSVQDCGTALRQAAAELRSLLVAEAADRLGAEVEEVEVGDGKVTAPSGASAEYWSLADRISPDHDVSGKAAPKAAAGYRLVGTSLPRRDLPDKVKGIPSFVHDMEMEDLLFARVVRPPSNSARLAEVDLDRTASLPGMVAVVRDGSFLGVIAEREEQAIRGHRRLGLDAQWETPDLKPAGADPRYLLELPCEDEVASEKRDQIALAGISRTLEAEYTRPFIAHASIGPSCAVALWGDDGLTVWTHSQGVFPLRFELARVLGLPETHLRVVHTEGAGCYGHNGADDCALDAALLARAVPGRPIKLQWTREDEFAFEPYGSAMVVHLSGSVDERGEVVDWSHELWSHTHTNRSGASDGFHLLAAEHMERSLPRARPRDASLPQGGTLRNAVPIYEFPNERVVSHFIPESPRRTSSLRSLGAHMNVFAIESFMDELAQSAGVDPIEFRLRHLRDPRARAVIETVAEMAGRTRVPSGEFGRGIGFARYKNLGCYAAVIVEVEAEHEIRLIRAWGAVDVGLAVNPDGVANQIEGGIIQSASWTIKEAVAFEGDRVVTRDWSNYPILTFGEVPEIEVQVLNRSGHPPVGAGEGVQGPTAAAIANAVNDAIGVRLRDMPFTPDRVVSAILSS